MAEDITDTEQGTPPLPKGYEAISKTDSSSPALPKGYFTLKKKDSTEQTSTTQSGNSGSGQKDGFSDSQKSNLGKFNLDSADLKDASIGGKPKVLAVPKEADLTVRKVQLEKQIGSNIKDKQNFKLNPKYASATAELHDVNNKIQQNKEIQDQNNKQVDANIENQVYKWDADKTNSDYVSEHNDNEVSDYAREGGKNILNVLGGIGNIFPKTVNAISGGTLDLPTFEPFEKKIPFEKETAQANEEVNQAKKQNHDFSVTPEEFNQRVKDIFVEQNKKAQFKANAIDLLSSSNPEIQERIKAKYINSMPNLDKDAKANSVQIQIVSNRHATLGDEIAKTKKLIESGQADENTIEDFKSKANEYSQLEQQYSKLIEDQQKITNKKLTADERLKLFSLDYSPFNNYVDNLVTPTAKMIGEGLYALGKTADKMAELPIVGDDRKEKGEKSILTNAGDSLIKSADELSSTHPQVSFAEGTSSPTNFGRWVTQTVGQVTPYVLGSAIGTTEEQALSKAFLTPSKALAGFSTASAGGAMHEMDSEMANNPDVNYNNWQYAGKVLGSVGSNALMFGNYGSMLKGNKALFESIAKTPEANVEFQKGVKDYLNSAIKSTKEANKSGAIMMGSQAINMFVDNHILGKKHEDGFDELANAYIEGGAMHTLIATVPNLATNMIEKVLPNESKKLINENLKKGYGLTKELENPALTPDERKVVRSKIDEVHKDNERLLKASNKQVEGFTQSQVKELLTIDQDKFAITKDVEEIKNGNYSKEYKESALAEKKAEFKQLEARRQDVFGNEHNALTLLPKSEQNRLEREAKTRIAEKDGKEVADVKFDTKEVNDTALRIHKSELKEQAIKDAETKSVTPETEPQAQVQKPIDAVQESEEIKSNDSEMPKEDYNKLSPLKKELVDINAPKKVIDAISDETTLKKPFLIKTKNVFDSLGTEGMADFETNEVKISKLLNVFSKKGYDKTLLHEAVHAGTALTYHDIISNPNNYTEQQVESAFQLNNIANRYSESTSKTSKNISGTLYGAKDPFEFISEFVSNEKFREYVGKTSEYEKVNAVDYVWSKILEMMGISKKTIDNSRIENISKFIDDILDASTEKIKKTDNEEKEVVDSSNNGNVGIGNEPSGEGGVSEQQTIEPKNIPETIDTKPSDGNSKIDEKVKREVGASHDALENLADRLGLEKPQRGEYIDPKEQLERGKLLVKNGADAKEVEKEFLRVGKKKVSADEISVARAYQQELIKKIDRLSDENKKDTTEYEDIKNELERWNSEVLKPMGAVFHETGSSLQGVTDIDTGSFHSVKRAFEDKQGRKVSKEQEKLISELTEKVKSSEKELSELTKKLDEKINNATDKESKKSPKEKSKDLAERIRKLKIHKPKTFHSATPASLVWDGAVELVAKSIEAGGSIADAIKDGIEHVKNTEWYSSLNKDEKKEAVETFENTFKDNFGNTDILTQFVDKKDNKFDIDEVQAIWKYAKENYLDKNFGYSEMINNVGTDLGLSPEQVREAIAQPKGARVITDEMYMKINRRRNAINRAKYEINNAGRSKLERTIRQTPNFFFKLLTFGHGTVAPITHAGNQIFKPAEWKQYAKFMINTYKDVGSIVNYEKERENLLSQPDFVFWKRNGLAVDPEKAYEDYVRGENFLGKLSQAGDRGFFALKPYRLELAKKFYDGLPDSIKSDPNTAKEIAKLVNHSTGAHEINFGSADGLVNTVFFAPKLEATKWANLIVDPIKAVNTLAFPSKHTVGERASAKIALKKSATMLATYSALLAGNSAMLALSGSKDKINYTDPFNPNWLKFKVGGKNVEVSGGMLASLRLMASLIDVAKKAHTGQYSKKTEANLIAQQLRYKLSPFASTVADIYFGKDAMGTPLPYLGAKSRHKDPYTIWSYMAHTKTPIPVAEAIREYDEEMKKKGMTNKQIKAIVNGVGMGIIVGATGAKISNDFKHKNE